MAPPPQEYLGTLRHARRPSLWRRWMATSSNGMALGNASLPSAVRFCIQEGRRGGRARLRWMG